VVPSSNTDIIGVSGNKYLSPCFDLSPSSSFFSSGIGLNEDVRHRVLVVLETGHGELAGDDAAAEPRVALEHEHFLAGRREVGGCDEPVVSGADGDNVGCGGAHSIFSCFRM
jgi:hypothetical protein